ncbi:MAG TPA: alkaline phosphatase family protein [Candidatus Limnocylindria bacterium]|nr:alkaline phosphatase family protein [Candidatus Limnocylindria bacterium]
MSRVLLAALLVAVACAPLRSHASGVAEAARATLDDGYVAHGWVELPADPRLRPYVRRLPHVFVVVMENTSLARAIASQPIGALVTTYGLATNYHGVARPSLPNYLAMTSGSTWGVTDNGYRVLPATGIGAQLTAAGVPWRAYMEGMTEAGCLRSPYPYALKHNPFAFYGGGCSENVVPIEALDSDLAKDTPNFLFIKPGLCHDGHDCAVDVAGEWLEGLVSRVVAADAWRDRGVLFVTWDEGDGGDTSNLVPLIVIASPVGPRRSDAAYDHYSLLATIEDLFGLDRLGAAADATPLTDVLPQVLSAGARK